MPVVAREAPVADIGSMLTVELTVALPVVLFDGAGVKMDGSAVGVGVDGTGVTEGLEPELMTRLILDAFPEVTWNGSEYTEQLGLMAA